MVPLVSFAGEAARLARLAPREGGLPPTGGAAAVPPTPAIAAAPDVGEAEEDAARLPVGAPLAVGVRVTAGAGVAARVVGGGVALAAVVVALSPYSMNLFEERPAGQWTFGEPLHRLYFSPFSHQSFLEYRFPSMRHKVLSECGEPKKLFTLHRVLRTKQHRRPRRPL